MQLRLILCLVAGVASSGAHSETVATRVYLDRVEKHLPNMMCQDHLYFLKCYRVTAQECQGVMESAVQGCIQGVYDRSGTLPNQIDVVQATGLSSSIGACAGESYHNVMTRYSIDSVECRNLGQGSSWEDSAPIVQGGASQQGETPASTKADPSIWESALNRLGSLVDFGPSLTDVELLDYWLMPPPKMRDRPPQAVWDSMSIVERVEFKWENDRIYADRSKYKVAAKLRNVSGSYYIKYVTALCSFFDGKGNRISNDVEIYLSGPADIAPGNSGTVRSGGTDFFHAKPQRAQCKVIKVHGEK